MMLPPSVTIGTSYSHRGGYYTLDTLAHFDERGLWTFAGVRFSRAGTLLATAESLINHAEAGHFAEELDNLLGVGTQDSLRKLVADGRLTRHKLASQFLYCAADRAHQAHQLRARRLLLATPGLGQPLPACGESRGSGLAPARSSPYTERPWQWARDRRRARRRRCGWTRRTFRRATGILTSSG